MTPVVLFGAVRAFFGLFELVAVLIWQVLDGPTSLFAIDIVGLGCSLRQLSMCLTDETSCKQKTNLLLKLHPVINDRQEAKGQDENQSTSYLI